MPSKRESVPPRRQAQPKKYRKNICSRFQTVQEVQQFEKQEHSRPPISEERRASTNRTHTHKHAQPIPTVRKRWGPRIRLPSRAKGTCRFGSRYRIWSSLKDPDSHRPFAAPAAAKQNADMIPWRRVSIRSQRSDSRKRPTPQTRAVSTISID